MIMKSSQRFVASSSIYCARWLAPVGAVSPSPLRPPRFCPLLIHSNSCCDIQTENIQVMTKLCTNLSSVSRNILVIMMVPISHLSPPGQWCCYCLQCVKLRPNTGSGSMDAGLRLGHYILPFWPLHFNNCKMLLCPFPPPKNVHKSQAWLQWADRNVSILCLSPPTVQ